MNLSTAAKSGSKLAPKSFLSKVKVFKHGRMVPSMTVSGSMGKQVEKVSSFTPMETSTRGSLLRIRLTDREHIITKMVQGMSDNGKMT